MSERVLVTGGTGFLGRHLVDELNSNGVEVEGFNSKQFNLRKPIRERRLLPEYYDKIYHLAVSVKAGTYNIYHKGETWLTNTLINANMIDFWLKEQKRATFCTMGTSCAYSPNSEMIEENYLTGEPDMDLYGYANSKRSLLWGLRACKDQYDTDYQYFIPSTLCGPMFDEDDCHFQFDFIKKICAAKYKGEEAVFWGDGSQRREILDVNDAVKIITTTDILNTPINLSTGKEYDLKTYAEIICAIVDYPVSKIKWDKTKWTGTGSKNLINTYLKDFEFTPIEETFERTVEYYVRTNYKR